MLAVMIAVLGGLQGLADLVAKPRDVVLSMFEAFDRHDVDAMVRLYAPEARLTSPDYCRPRGGDDVPRSHRTLFAEFPDIRDELESVVAEGDLVAVRFTAISSQGELFVPIQAMLRVRDGLIVSDDALFDTGGKPGEP